MLQLGPGYAEPCVIGDGAAVLTLLIAKSAICLWIIFHGYSMSIIDSL